MVDKQTYNFEQVITMIPCPFCGHDQVSDLKFPTITYKKDRKKILGVYHTICTIKCGDCTCTISQAGVNKEDALKHAMNIWNKRAEVSKNEE